MAGAQGSLLLDFLVEEDAVICYVRPDCMPAAAACRFGHGQLGGSSCPVPAGVRELQADAAPPIRLSTSLRAAACNRHSCHNQAASSAAVTSSAPASVRHPHSCYVLVCAAISKLIRMCGRLFAPCL